MTLHDTTQPQATATSKNPSPHNRDFPTARRGLGWL